MEKPPMQINEDFTIRSKLQDLGRWYVTQFVKETAQKLPPGTAILDAGAGECAYKKYFAHCNYKSVDLGVGDDEWNYQHLDYVAPLDNLPIEDATFDAVLCTQTLEHLEWPRESVKEMYRVLKPGGTLYLTAPMAHIEHQTPYDFFRYTSFGLKSICNHAGFSDVEIIPFGGTWVRWAYELRAALSILPGAGFRSGVRKPGVIAMLPVRAAVAVIVRVLQRLFLRLDRFDKLKNHPFGWGVIAHK